MRLLMVENHAVFAATVTQTFLGAHQVTVVPSIAAARATLSAGYDAVLVDYDLDDGKGDALVRDLVASGFAGRIIAISSHEAGNQALLSAGAHASCPKTRFNEIARWL